MPHSGRVHQLHRAARSRRPPTPTTAPSSRSCLRRGSCSPSLPLRRLRAWAIRVSLVSSKMNSLPWRSVRRYKETTGATAGSIIAATSVPTGPGSPIGPAPPCPAHVPCLTSCGPSEPRPAPPQRAAPPSSPGRRPVEHAEATFRPPRRTAPRRRSSLRFRTQGRRRSPATSSRLRPPGCPQGIPPR